jgi:putative transposase
MDESEHDMLAYMNFPVRHRTRRHSTNPLERLNEEVGRRANIVGIFANEAAVTRLVDAILLEQNDVGRPMRHGRRILAGFRAIRSNVWCGERRESPRV